MSLRIKIVDAWWRLRHFHVRHEYEIPGYTDDGFETLYCIRGWECEKHIHTGHRVFDVVQAPDRPAGAFIHTSEMCEGFPCAWHAPSDHHMRDWPKVIRFDRPDLLTERICPDNHVGHPDPDTLAHLARADALDPDSAGSEWHGVHGCDGCCAGPKVNGGFFHADGSPA